MVILFFVILVLGAYPYVVYPILLPALVALFGRPLTKKHWTPKVSLIIPVYNEQAVIAQKLGNTLSLDYPTESLEILVGSDGSTDLTVEIVEGFRERRVKLLEFGERRGKPSVLCDLAAESTGEILILTDASALLDSRAVREIVEAFGSEEIGVVSGEMVPRHGEGVVATLDIYRRMDNRLRRLEGRLHSSMGAAGALYGIRRDLFTPPEPDTILDDFVTPLRTVLKGRRVIICPEARFWELERTTFETEFRRKVRTLAGNFQAVARLSRLAIPLKSPVWFSLVSHKLIRLLTPYVMLALFVLNVFLVGHPWFHALLAAQVAFYLAALLGWRMKHRARTIGLLHYPYMFVLMQMANLMALPSYLGRSASPMWKRQAAAGETVAVPAAEAVTRR